MNVDVVLSKVSWDDPSKCNWFDSIRHTAKFKHLWYKECQSEFSSLIVVSDLFFIFLIGMCQGNINIKKSFIFFYICVYMYVYIYNILEKSKPKPLAIFFFLPSKPHSLILCNAVTCKHFLDFWDEGNGSRLLNNSDELCQWLDGIGQWKTRGNIKKDRVFYF